MQIPKSEVNALVWCFQLGEQIWVSRARGALQATAGFDAL